MNDKINVAAILKDKPQGTKLYSPLCGDCWLITADYSGDGFGKDFPIVVSRDKDGKANALRTLSFTAQGTFIEGVGECILFPSKEMRDWEKYPKQEFKSGDILYKKGYGQSVLSCIFIFDTTRLGVIAFYAALILKPSSVELTTDRTAHVGPSETIDKVRLATDSEKKQLFDALAKEGKRWNAETKTLEDLPKKHEFMPFERVLVRDYDDEEWCASFFSHYADKEKAQTITVNDYGSQQCIPYEGNEHLLGTTNSPR